MRRHARIFLEGLLVIVPVLVTGYVVAAAILWIDESARALFARWNVEVLPGLGLAAALAAIYLVGLLTHVWVLRWLGRWAGSLLERLPLVKTLYGSVRDLLAFLKPKEAGRRGGAVRVALGDGAHMLGIATGEREGMVGVYLPMSYQLGGFLIYVPRERTAEAGMDVEAALKLIITGGMGETK